jgi:hypothetical protein
MKETRSPRTALLCLAPILIAVASCATVSGGTLAKVTAAEKGDAGPKKTVQQATQSISKPSASKGLQIISDPDGAEVFLNGNLVGNTPLVLEKLEKGRYQIEIRKNGYETVISWIDFPGDSMLYQTALVMITGYLSLSVAPPGSIVSIDGGTVNQGVLELPIGSYSVLARAFGFGDQRMEFVILPRSMTSVDITLEPVDFAITKLSALRSTLNPDDPGMLGILEISFSVSGPGDGEISVFDVSSNVVYRHELSPFTTWDYSYTWDCKGTEGRPLPDGEYRFVLSGLDADSGAQDSEELVFRMDRTVRKTLRTVWSGSSGLMYAPSADVLPDGGIHLAMLGAAGLLGTPLFRAPVQLTMRLGLGGSFELDVNGGFIFSESAPFFLGAAGRFPLVRASGGQGFSAVVDAKASFQYNPLIGVLATDTLSNFTGLSVGLPLQYTLGPASILASASVIVTLWNPYDAGVPTSIGFSSWAYFRGGVLLDFGSVSGGISASARTAPFTSGSVAVATPFQAAAEAHWLIPGTHLVLSGVVMGEIEDYENFYFLEGIGFGLIY